MPPSLLRPRQLGLSSRDSEHPIRRSAEDLQRGSEDPENQNCAMHLLFLQEKTKSCLQFKTKIDLLLFTEIVL